MLLGRKEYRFIKEFSSPTVGNVYIGRKLVMSHSQGQKFVAAGLAEEVKEQQKEAVANVKRGNAGGSKAAS